MKTKFLIVFFTITLVSCKSDKQEQNIENQEVVEEVANLNFNVEISASASKKDDFALYFTEDYTINFVAENAIWCAIEANNLDSKLYFEIPNERLPTHVRLDFGLNKEQDSVIVKNVKFNYLKNSFEFKGSDFFQYFNQDPQFKTVVNTSTGTFTIYKDGTEYKTPFFYPNDVLVAKIAELTNTAN